MQGNVLPKPSQPYKYTEHQFHLTFFGWKVAAGLAESNGGLPLGMTYKVTCWLTACILGCWCQ